MLVRQPVVAGRFYQGDKESLKAEVQSYLARGEEHLKARAPQKSTRWGVMLPHAGYVYCGQIIGDTLAGCNVPDRLIILCPNHTGHGRMLGVWPDGIWRTPLGEVKVDAGLATELMEADGGFEPDIASHLGEHSIEVLLPFLQELKPNLSIVPITVGTRDVVALERAGYALAAVLRKNGNVGLVVSSDMNHYEDHETTLDKDELALAKVCVADPVGLLDVTARENISMCGAPALALALFAGKELGNEGVAIIAHDTSGSVSGDYEHVVGYAGLHLCKGTPGLDK